MKQTKLSPAAEKFVLHWGEMGARWGVNRTVAQIHALLFLSKKPMDAEEIADTLSVARSNVSVSLRELQSWKLIKAVPALGDRREHFETHKDVWEMFKVILDGRKQREIDPTLEILRECVAEAGDEHTSERLKSMTEFFESASYWYDSIRPLPAGVAKRLMKMGGKVSKMLAAGLLVVCVGTASAQKSGDSGFSDSLKGLSGTPLTIDGGLKKLIKIGVADYFRSHTLTIGKPAIKKAAGKAIASITLAPLRNKQWSSAAFFSMGGKTTSLSGQFARSRKAYFAVFPDGAELPAFISLDDLIDGDAGILVNNVEYRLTLSPNLFDRLSSKVQVKRAADGDLKEVTMRKILDKVYANGVSIQSGEKQFRMFYGQDVDDRGEAPVAGKFESIALLTTDATDYTTFLIPLEYVPTDGSAGEFLLRPGLTLTLRLQSGVLEVY